MFKRTLSLLVFLILIPISSFSVYDSFDDLQEQLGEAGYPVVMRLSSGDFSTKIFVKGHSEGISINAYANSDINNRPRKTTFDFINEQTGAVSYEAYKVADIFVCYLQISRKRLLRRATFELIKAKPSYKLAESFDFCLIIPAPIDEVERALARVRSSNSASNDEEIIKEKDLSVH